MRAFVRAGVLGAVVLCAVAPERGRTTPAASAGFAGTSLGSAPAPAIELVDQRGAPFTLSALRGSVAVVVFGYSHCDDVCPTTLARLHRTLAELPPERRVHVRVVFVTVDPARDDPARLDAYLARFDPRFIGVTGGFAQLRPVWSAYHVFRQRLPPRRMGRPYLVAHEGLIYLIDRNGLLRVRHGWQDAPAAIARDLTALTAMNGSVAGAQGRSP